MDADSIIRRVIATHRSIFPEQYTHPMCGRAVVVRPAPGVVIHGVVERVLPSERWGDLILLDTQPRLAYRLSDAKEVEA